MYQFSGKIKTFSLTLITIGFLATGWSFYNGLNKTSADAKAALAAEQHGDHGILLRTTMTAVLNKKHITTIPMNRMQEKSTVHLTTTTIQDTVRKRKLLTNYIKCTTDHGLRCMYPYYFS